MFKLTLLVEFKIIYIVNIGLIPKCELFIIELFDIFVDCFYSSLV